MQDSSSINNFKKSTRHILPLDENTAVFSFRRLFSEYSMRQSYFVTIQKRHILIIMILTEVISMHICKFIRKSKRHIIHLLTANFIIICINVVLKAD